MNNNLSSVYFNFISQAQDVATMENTESSIYIRLKRKYSLILDILLDLLMVNMDINMIELGNVGKKDDFKINHKSVAKIQSTLH